MKGKLPLLLILVAIVLIGGCSQGKAPGATPAGTPTTILTTETVLFTGESSTIDIEIKEFKFVPDSIEAKAGEIVMLNIVSLDQVEHTFTLSAFSRELKLPAGSEGSIQFLADRAGTFEFYCRFHPNMRGTLIVK